MSDYVKTTNFTAKDALTVGDPNKKIKGSEHDTEFDNIATMSATKTNKVASPVTGNIAKLTASGDLADAGYSFSNLIGAATPSLAEINKLTGLATTAVELGYVNGVTSAIQTQLDGKMVGSNNLSELTDASAARTALGLGALAVLASVGSAQIDANAITNSELGADAVKDTNIDWTFTGGSVTLSGSGDTWLIPEGLYLLTQTTVGDVQLDVNVSSTWRNGISNFIGGLVVGNGALSRLRKSDTGGTTFYYIKLA